MSSEGGTPSHPRAGLYVFVPRSQFSKGEGRCDGDQRIQRNERERILEPPGIDAGRRPSFPIRVERSLERPRQIRIVHDEADLAILRRGTERPVHARDQDRAAVHHGALVVETFNRPPRLEQSDLEREALELRATVDSLEDIVVRPRLRLDGRPASVKENPHRNATMSRRECRLQERIRSAPPEVVQVERLDREPVRRRSEQPEDPILIEGRVRSQDEAGGLHARYRDPGLRGHGRGQGKPLLRRLHRSKRVSPSHVEVGLEDRPEG